VLMNMKPGQLTRHEVWADVTRKKAPALSSKGRAARRRRWLAEYGRLSDSWRDKGDIDEAIYWAQRATAVAEEERYAEESEASSSELR
jgi:hypothetical protein